MKKWAARKDAGSEQTGKSRKPHARGDIPEEPSRDSGCATWIQLRNCAPKLQPPFVDGGPRAHNSPQNRRNYPGEWPPIKNVNRLSTVALNLTQPDPAGVHHSEHHSEHEPGRLILAGISAYHFAEFSPNFIFHPFWESRCLLAWLRRWDLFSFVRRELVLSECDYRRHTPFGSASSVRFYLRESEPAAPHGRYNAGATLGRGTGTRTGRSPQYDFTKPYPDYAAVFQADETRRKGLGNASRVSSRSQSE
jgi:hypothetical protein